MEELGLGDDSTKQNMTTDPASRRRANIQLCIESLAHACNCRDYTNCGVKGCLKMKRVVQHAKSCKLKTKGGCVLCQQLISLCCYHAKHCQDSRCPVPFCLRVKHKLGQTPQAQINAGNMKKAKLDHEVIPIVISSMKLGARSHQHIKIAVTKAFAAGEPYEAASTTIFLTNPFPQNQLLTLPSPIDLGPNFAALGNQTGHLLTAVNEIQDWHQTLSSDVRNDFIQKFVHSICPSLISHPSILQDPRMTRFISYAKLVESDIFKMAKSREEYCILLAQKTDQIKKQLEAKRQKRRIEQLAPPNTGAENQVDLELAMLINELCLEPMPDF